MTWRYSHMEPCSRIRVPVAGLRRIHARPHGVLLHAPRRPPLARTAATICRRPGILPGSLVDVGPPGVGLSQKHRGPLVPQPA